MHAQVNRNQDEVILEEVHLLCPPTYTLVAAGQQFGVEECAEAVDFGHTVLSSSFHQQVHIEINHLQQSAQMLVTCLVHQ